jgi:hypothetical protein
LNYLVKIYDSKYMIDGSAIALTRIANLLCYFGLQSTVTLDYRTRAQVDYGIFYYLDLTICTCPLFALTIMFLKSISSAGGVIVTAENGPIFPIV